MDPKTILNVGDRVVVRKDLREENNYPEDGTSLGATMDMVKLAGETVVITRVVYGWNMDGSKDFDDDPRRYFAREECSDEDVMDPVGDRLFWCPSMFSGFAQDDTPESFDVPQEDIFEFMIGGKP